MLIAEIPILWVRKELKIEANIKISVQTLPKKLSSKELNMKIQPTPGRYYRMKIRWSQNQSYILMVTSNATLENTHGAFGNGLKSGTHALFKLNLLLTEDE